MNSALFLLAWLAIMLAAYVALTRRRRSTAPARPHTQREHTTVIRLGDKDNQPLVGRAVTLEMSSLEQDSYAIAARETLVNYTNTDGVVIFRHKIVGYASLHLDFAHNRVTFPVPGTLRFNVTMNGVAFR